ncbi:MAG: alpha/beta hydrolase [Bryobacteraceae bacterium]
MTGIRLVHLYGLLAVSVTAWTGCGANRISALDRLKPCTLEEGPAEGYCGSLEVYENRAAHSGRKIKLKIVVLPALRRKALPDPLFALAGGPGQGAAKSAKFFQNGFQRLQEERDIVLVDQRGTGDSNPLNCEPADADQDDLSKLDRVPVERFRKCLDKFQADPRFYTTTLAMDDLDDVRRYLGYGQINLWGGSYGTRAALVYLKQHPDAVRTVILDGVAPPDMRLPLYVARDSQRAFDLLAKACAEDKDCQSRFPDLGGKINAVLARLEREKPKVRITHPRTGERVEAPLTRQVAALVVFGALYSPQQSALLPRIIEDAAAGDFQTLFALATSAEGAAGMMSEGMFLSVVCTEDMPRISRGEVLAETSGRFVGDAMFRLRMKPCEFWPKGDLPESFYQPVVSGKPVLILSGGLDPVTPPEWGEHVAKQLKNSRHIVVPAAGHGTSTLGCVPVLLKRFLNEANGSRLDASCVSQIRRPPFFSTRSGPLVFSPKP